MHDLYYKGRIHTRHNHVNTGYNTKRVIKLGSEKHPLTLVVTNASHKVEVEKILSEHGLFAHVNLDEEGPENLVELETILNKPTTTRFDKVPKRNDPCFCGSSKKYKKCCG
jgi:SWIM/SEC-C metal-binding protein